MEGVRVLKKSQLGEMDEDQMEEIIENDLKETI